MLKSLDQIRNPIELGTWSTIQGKTHEILGHELGHVRGLDPKGSRYCY